MRRIWDATKAFMLTKRSRETAVFMFFVLLSALFWLIQTLNETFDMQMRFPLQLEKVPENVVITSDIPADVDVTVRDKGTALLKYVFTTVVQPVVVNFNDHDDGSLFGHVILTHPELMPQISDDLLSTTNVVEIRPDTIEYFYSRGGSKRMAVLPRGRITTDALYYLAGVTCNPDSVTVWAPSDMLDTMTAVTTSPLNLDRLTETRTLSAQLTTLRGMKTDPTEVMVTAEVDMFTEKSVSVPIIGTNFPAGYSLRTFPGVVTVRFRVGAKDYKKITAENFVITATYEELIDLPRNAKLWLKLRSLPEGVSQVHIVPEEVDFLIEQANDSEHANFHNPGI